MFQRSERYRTKLTGREYLEYKWGHLSKDEEGVPNFSRIHALEAHVTLSHSQDGYGT